MLLSELARTSHEMTRTSARSAKTALLADLFRSAEPADAPVVISYLAGRLPQRRIGVGWAVLRHPRPAATRPTLTVREVDARLAGIAEVSGAGAQARRRELVDSLLESATEEEQRFLIGLLSGELRQGALDALALEGLAAALGIDQARLRRATMLSGSLGEVAGAVLAGGPAALDAYRLEVGRPVLPMLARTGKDLAETVAGLAPCAVEEKLDGVRVQVHRDGPAVRVYTRTLEEITERVPEVVETVLGYPSPRLVLDGEVISLGADGRPRSFQDVAGRVASRVGVAEARAALPVSAVFFDALLVGDRDLLDVPADERATALAAVVPEPDRVRRVLVDTGPAGEGADEDDLARARAFLAQTLERGHEGVMVKGLASTYSAGRRGASWRKLKPVHTLDLVVLAAEWGHGRRSGKLSNLHLGALRPDGSPAMLGKTFKGLTDALLRWQTERLQELAVSEEPWGVVVRPELVVEVAFDGVQRSTRYPEGVTLRFARVVRFREDKTAAEADTVAAVRALLPGGEGG
ncbi:ATP-dependent DNA ligase [Streptomyces sp. NPDC059740]|uniref:ATP-dependent DNA ligase n=1 Tax=Streptomyces sp. NPDC059740 TaxID=3346926 RepID=UPI00365FDFA1